LKVTNEVVALLTKLIGGIAAVSLLVGGIGIMNVMLVSVSERTREIGIRKAVGATTRQIRTQFLIEAVVLSVWGATIGLLIAGFINVALRVATHFEPIITWQVVAIAAGVSIVVGIVFGAAPAFKAARKDPIEALRSM
jgi:putative ABC transport system permease protein